MGILTALLISLCMVLTVISLGCRLTYADDSVSYFGVSVPSSVTVGVLFNVTVTAYYQNNTVDTSYTGSVYFTSSDSQAVLPYTTASEYTFTSGTGDDNGQHIFSGFILKTAGGSSGGTGSQTITVTDSAASISQTSSSITVNAGSASIFSVSGFPNPTTAGFVHNVEVTAYDAYNNVATGFSATVTISSSDSKASLSSPSPLTDGIGFFSVVLITEGFQTITASATGVTSGSQTGITVNPGSLDHITISPADASITAGQSQTYAVDSYDRYNNLITAGVAASFKVNSKPIANNTVSETVAGSYTIEADYSSQATTTLLTINPSAATSFAVSSGINQTAGTAFTTTVTAYDAYNNTATSCSDAVTFASSDPKAVFPSPSALTDGAGSFSVTLKTAGTQSINVTDTSNSSVTGSQTGIIVAHGPPTTLTISPSTATIAAGNSQQYTVQAFDAYNNSLGDVTSSSVFSVNGASINGNYVSETSIGTYAVTATYDGVTSNSATLQVSATAGTSFTVSGFPSSITAGTSAPITVTARDQYGNVATSYAGTVKITSSDSNAILPANAGLTNGAGTFSVILKTAGMQSITATDTVTPSITGSQTGIIVKDATVAALTITPASTITAGASKTFSAIASDKYGNFWDVTSATAWSISSGAGGQWSGNVYTSAIAGTWTVTATYASQPSPTTLTVTPATLDHFSFGQINGQTAGASFPVTITAQDTYGNTVTSFTGVASLEVSAGSINPTSTGQFVNGVWTGSVTLDTAGSGVTITASETGETGTSNTFTVSQNTGPSPTPTPITTPTPTPKASNTPSPKPTSVPTPKTTPTPTPSPIIMHATTENGNSVNLAISGNITVSQISDLRIATNQSSSTTTVSFSLTGQSGDTGFSSLTIPKSAIPYGTVPIVYVDGESAASQGYTQDSQNFYIWYTTHFSSHQVKILFTEQTPTHTQTTPLIIIVILISVAVAGLVVIVRMRFANKNKKQITWIVTGES